MKNEKVVSTVVAALLVISAFSALCTPASAATDDEIEQAIANGTAWLADAQQDDGSWNGGGGTRDIGATGLALLKFIEYAKEQGMNPTDSEYIYSDNVNKSLEFLDSNLMTDTVPVGGYDGNLNGNMAYFLSGTYVTGIATMAYAANPDTPQDLVQDLTDWLVNAQCTLNMQSQYGVWSYNGFSCSGDNSNTGYATLGLGYALNADATIPPTTTTALSSYVDYIQNDPGAADNGSEDDPDGGSGYGNPSSWVNSLKTGNLIYEAVLSGDAVDSSRILNATDYIDRHWNDDIEGWIGNSSAAPYPYNTQYQATYTIMKGFEAIGLQELNGKDWFDQISTAIVDDQLPDGNWTNGPNYVSQDGWAYIATDELCTAWALLTLEKITPLEPMTPGKVTGGGQIKVEPVIVKKKIVDKASFGFVVIYDEGYPAPKGELEYLDTGMNIHAHDMTKLVVSPEKTQAWFEGTCTIDGVSGHTFEAYVEDNNEPGMLDVFEIALDTGYAAGGELLGGNIQIHKKP